MAINFSRFDQWLVPSSRMLLGLLVLANVSLAIVLNVTSEPVEQNTASASLPLMTSPAVGEAPVPQDSSDENPAVVVVDALTAGEAATVGREAQIFSPAEELPPRECRVWGPESEPEAFATLSSELRALGSFPEIKALDVQAAADYLVMIDNLGSRDNAKRVTGELDRMEIENFIMTREDGSVAISVGVFSQQPLAKRQLKKVQGLGYSAQIEQLHRSQTVYNLTAHVAVDSPLYTSSISSCLNIAQGR